MLYARLVCVLVAFLGLASPALAQTNPCTDVVGTVYNPTTVYATLPGYNDTLPGTTEPRVTAWQVGIFNNGVDLVTGAPVSTATIPRANWVLEPGTADCYRAQPNELLALPLGVLQFASARVVDQSGPGAWGGTSNPFSRLAAVMPPTAVRVTK